MRKDLIYNTLAFFDAQELPLTLLEVRDHLVAKEGVSTPLFLGELERILREELSGQITQKQGLYFLSGRDSLVARRRTNYRTALQRFFKAKKYLRALRYFPYLRAVAISGSQAQVNASPRSDIDLFILTSPRRIWLARTLVSVYFQILGQRRHGQQIAGRFCLNHYLVAGQQIAEDRNLYTATEYASLLPVIGQQQLEKFWRQNQWIGEFVSEPMAAGAGDFFGWQFSKTQRVLETILDFTIATPLNYLLGVYQKHRIRMQEHILVSDTELSFHPGSRGQRVLAGYKAKTRPTDNNVHSGGQP